MKYPHLSGDDLAGFPVHTARALPSVLVRDQASASHMEEPHEQLSSGFQEKTKANIGNYLFMYSRCKDSSLVLCAGNCLSYRLCYECVREERPNTGSVHSRGGPQVVVCNDYSLFHRDEVKSYSHRHMVSLFIHQN